MTELKDICVECDWMCDVRDCRLCIRGKQKTAKTLTSDIYLFNFLNLIQIHSFLCTLGFSGSELMASNMANGAHVKES